MGSNKSLLLLPQLRLLLPLLYDIDFSHPLANGLIGCYLPGISHGANLVGAANHLDYDTAPQGESISLEGPAHIFNQANSGLLGAATGDFLTNPISWYWRGVTITANNTSADLCGVGNASGTSIATGSINHNGANLTAFWNHGGTLASFTIGACPAAKTLFSAGCGFPGPGANVTAYLNGVQSGTPTAFGAGAATTSTPRVNIGTLNITKTRFSATDTILAYAWNRMLTADEHLYLHNNPYCFLRTSEKSIGVILLPSSDVIGTLNITEANDTLSAAGELPILGSLSVTEANDTISAAGIVDLIIGTLIQTEADDTLLAEGSAGSIIGELSITEDDDTLLAEGFTGTNAIGTLDIIEDDDTVVAFGGEPQPPPVAQRIPGIEWQAWDRAFEPKRTYI